jgi:hypothetical protein
MTLLAIVEALEIALGDPEVPDYLVSHMREAGMQIGARLIDERLVAGAPKEEDQDMEKKDRYRQGVPVLRISRGGDLYRVDIQNGDYFFLSLVEKWELDSLKPGQFVRVSDMGRTWILWRERRQFIAYERTPD